MNNRIEAADEKITAIIRRLNDELRQTFVGGAIRVTPSVIALGSKAQKAIVGKVRGFGAFDERNDPFGEHDFGAFDLDGEKVFFKIDYYNREMTAGSENPADQTVTTRVLTIMLAEDY
ncbi:DUF3768 domain-containing protein [Bosea sp. NPDC055594]